MTEVSTPRERMRARAEVRLAICRACPALVGRKPFERCLDCGCLMRAKVLPESTTCPRGKW